MSISADLLTYLKTVSAVTNIVGSGSAARIYPDAIKEGAARPCVVFQRSTSGEMSGIGGGLGLYRTQFEIYSFAATRAAADELDEIIYDNLQGGNRTLGSTIATEVYVGESDRSSGADSPVHGTDQYDYYALTRYTIWHI